MCLQWMRIIRSLEEELQLKSNIRGVEIQIDEGDLHLLEEYAWYIINKKGSIYITSRHNRRTVYLARIIMGDDINYLVDHINGDTLDNRRENLRYCDKRTNAQNSRSRKGSTSKYKGVSWDRFREKWRAMIKFEGRQIFIGRFDCETEAAKCYNHYAIKYFGEFARLNDV